MKIAIVLGPFHAMPPAGYGAVEKVWHQLACAFSRKGHDVTLIGKGAAGSRMPEPNLVTIGLRGHAASRSLAWNLLLDLRYAAGVARTVPPSDIVVTNSFWTPVLLSRLRPRAGKIVVHVARFPKGQMGLYRRAALVQAVSTVVADEVLRQAPALADKVRVLPNPIDADVFHPPPAARRYDGDMTVLYVGRVHPEKGIGLLVNAMRTLAQRRPAATLRIVGPWAIDHGGGGEAYVRSLQAAAGDARVEFAGPISDPDRLAEEYRRAHAFCYPSLAGKGEASPLAPLEAMSTGLPVIVSDLRCFRDYLDPEDNGLVFDHRAPDSPLQLAATLERVLSDPALARALGSRAAARARDFDMPAVAQRYLAMFESALAQRAHA